MKCPHCNQEHPDGFQFCPTTGQKINLLKACSNTTCSDYGKNILPLDSLYCPTCGQKLENNDTRDEESSTIRKVKPAHSKKSKSNSNYSHHSSEIEAVVSAIIVDKLGVSDSEVRPEASFVNDLGADSLDAVELIMEFEKAFSISIPDDEAEQLTTVGDAIAYIETASK